MLTLALEMCRNPAAALTRNKGAMVVGMRRLLFCIASPRRSPRSARPSFAATRDQIRTCESRDDVSRRSAHRRLHRRDRDEQDQAAEIDRLRQPRQGLPRQGRRRAGDPAISTRPIALDDHNADAFYNRGLAFRDRGDTDRATAGSRAGGQVRQAQRHRAQHAEPYLLRPARLRARHRRAQPGDQAQSQLRAGAVTTAAWPIAPRASRTAPFPTTTAPSSSIRNDAIAYHSRGLAYRDIRDYERAIQDFDQAIKIKPEFILALNDRGIAYASKGNVERAIQDFDQAILLDPRDAFAYNNRGLAYRNRGETDRAIKDYDQAVLLNPNYVLAYYNRGNAYYDKHDYDRAIANYDQAIRLDSEYALAYYDRGVSYFEKHDYDQALRDLARRSSSTQRTRCPGTIAASSTRRRASPTAPSPISTSRSSSIRKNGLAYYNRGLALRAKGEDERAIADFTPGGQVRRQECAGLLSTAAWPIVHAAISTARWPISTRRSRIDRKTPPPIYERGNARFDKRDYDRAIADLNMAINIKPDYTAAFNVRGLAYNAKGDGDRAIADFDQAIRIDPKNAAALTNRGDAYQKKRDYDRAIADFDQAIKADPNFAGAWLSAAASPTRTSATASRRSPTSPRRIKLDRKNADAYNGRGACYASSTRTTTPSRISTRRSGSSRTSAPPISTAAWRITSATTTTAPLPI